MKRSQRRIDDGQRIVSVKSGKRTSLTREIVKSLRRIKIDQRSQSVVTRVDPRTRKEKNESAQSRVILMIDEGIVVIVETELPTVSEIESVAEHQTEGENRLTAWLSSNNPHDVEPTNES